MKTKAFTLIELIVVIAIVAILVAIAIPSFSGLQNRATINVLENNQKTLETILKIGETLSGLPTIESGTPTQNRNTLAEIINSGNHYFANPKNKCTDIISTTQASSKNCAAIIISQRSVLIETAIRNQNTNLWPLNAAESSKTKFVGAIIIQICSDGYLIYSYPEYGKVHNLRKYSFS